MEDVARAKAQSAGLGLLIAGIIESVYLVGYTVWSVFSTAMSGLGTGIQAVSAADSGSYVGVGLSAWGFVFDALQLAGNALLLIPALLVIVGGLRLRALRSRGLVTLAALCAMGVPLASLVVGALSVVALDVCGAVCGCAPSIVVAVIGFSLGVWALLTVRDPMVAEVWELQ